jgi:hypothetical protein
MIYLPKCFIASVTALTLVLAAPVGFAQETTEAPAAEVPASASTGITLGLELLETLAAEEQAMTAAMEEISGGIEQALTDAENAGAIFEEMIAAVERMAEFGSPEGSYVTSIEATIDLAREIEIEAREADDPELMAQMQQEIGALESIRETALELYSDSFRTIRDIKAQRGRFLLRLRANQVTAAREFAENGLEIVRTHNQRLGEIRAAATGDTTEPVVAE